MIIYHILKMFDLKFGILENFVYMFSKFKTSLLIYLIEKFHI